MRKNNGEALDEGNTRASVPNYSEKRRFSPRIWIVLGLILVVIISIICLAATTSQSNDQYCKSIDPTGCNIKVKILNNTDKAYTIKQCEGTEIKCAPYAEIATLQPGQSRFANGSTEADSPQPWIVFNPQGEVAGCLNLQFTKSTPSPVTVQLASLRPCSQ